MAVFQSMDEGKTWTRIMLYNNAGVAKAIAVRLGGKPLLFAGGQATAHNPTKSLLFKSMNGGATWSEVTDLFGAAASVNAICFDPSNSKRVLVAADNGIWLSEDEGVTWTPPTQKQVMSSVVANSSKPGQFFAGSKEGVWMSNDGGRSWTEYGNGLTDRDITRLEIDVKNSLLYAGTQHAGVMRLSLKGQSK
jgi:photosystem II stability/assembly factor-like uncharacterized protein